MLYLNRGYLWGNKYSNEHAYALISLTAIAYLQCAYTPYITLKVPNNTRIMH